MSEDQNYNPIIFQVEGLPILIFDTIDQVADWYQIQAKDWQPLTNGRTSEPFESWRTQLFQRFNSIQSELDNLKRPTATPEERARSWEQMRSTLRMWSSEPWSVSQTALGDEVVKLAFQDRDLALLRIAAYQRQRIPLQSLGTQLDVGRLFTALAPVYFRSGRNEDAAEFQEKRIAYTTAELQKRVETVIGGAKPMMESLANHVEQIKSDYLAEKSALDDLVARYKKRSKKVQELVYRAMRSGRQEYRLLNETYKKHLQLEAPATYWRARASNSLIRSIAAFIGFIATAALVLIGFWLYHVDIKTFASDKAGSIQLGAVALISPIVILTVWLFRMISRVFGLSVAEYTDATQREVMVKTFLALTKDPGAKLSDGERFIILQALFRSGKASDEEEQIPTNLLEAFARAAQGSSK